VHAHDSYDVIDALVPSDFLPRLLNSQDIPNLRPTDPQPVFSPEGDFDHDGSTDVAISGIYTLKDGPEKYFLLVASDKGTGRYKPLFFRNYDRPVFLHKPGATGPADPNNQAFSMTFCSECSDGFDFYWDKSLKRFRQDPWKEKTERRQEMVTVAPLDVPSEVADKALQVAGKLPDVVAFTEGIKKAGKAFGVRVEYTDPLNQAAPVRVRIYEKKGAGEKLFDAIDVDVKKMSVVKRRRGNMGKENAK
jgi:hypothetical protein